MHLSDSFFIFSSGPQWPSPVALIMNYTRCASVQVFDALKDIGSNPHPYALSGMRFGAIPRPGIPRPE